ncbi:MAG: HAMP domain-containing histidine kinase [Actinomycetota bacterium]|nr:HAMP domain-containing histidine kinase [Actinomycetota bacterium]
MSLGTRVLAGFALIGVLLSLAAFLLVQSTSASLLAQLDRQLEDARGPLNRLDEFPTGDPYGRGGPGARPGGHTPGEPDGEPRLSSLYVLVCYPDGTQRAVATPDIGDAELPDIEWPRAWRAAETKTPYTLDNGQARFRVLAYPEPGTDGTVVLALPLTPVDATVARVTAVAWGTTAAILAVLALVAWWVIRLGIRPIKQMTATASAIAGGDLTHRVPEAPAKTEAGELGRSLNAMLSSIETAFDARGRSEQRLRRFAADASHELRTPVTTIRGYAELYRAGGLRGEGELGEAMARTESEAIRMGRLVDDLLLLARLDQGRALDRQPVNLTNLAAEAAADAAVRDSDREISGPTTTDAVLVLADPDRLRQVISNLVANALVHTPPGAPVSLDVAIEDEYGVLRVIDSGEGMPPEVEQRAFERFYRADPARSRQRGGSGLGLSIVESTVTALDGDVTLQTEAGKGLTATVRLPLAETPAAAP